MSIGLFGGGTTFFLVFNIPIYPFGANGLMVMVLILSYAITKHDLMDIKVVITRSVAYLIAGIIVSIFTLGLAYVINIYPDYGLPIFLTSSVILTLGGEYLILKIQTPLEKKFLKGNYNIDKIIKKISRTLITAQDRWAVLMTIAEAFKEDMELKQVYLMSPINEREPVRDGFMFTSADKEEDEGVFIEGTHPFIGYFERNSSVVQMKEFPSDIKKSIDTLGFHKHSVFIPIHSLLQFQGMVIVGVKLSEDKYSDRDISFLEAIVNQVIVVFDRISHQKKQRHANAKLKILNTKLEDLVELVV